jgi:hypothetical protein
MNRYLLNITAEEKQEKTIRMNEVVIAASPMSMVVKSRTPMT